MWTYGKRNDDNSIAVTQTDEQGNVLATGCVINASNVWEGKKAEELGEKEYRHGVWFEYSGPVNENDHGEKDIHKRLLSMTTYEAGAPLGKFAEYYPYDMKPIASFPARVMREGKYVKCNDGLPGFGGDVKTVDFDGNEYHCTFDEHTGTAQDGTYVSASGSARVWNQDVTTVKGGEQVAQTHTIYQKTSDGQWLWFSRSGRREDGSQFNENNMAWPEVRQQLGNNRYSL